MVFPLKPPFFLGKSHPKGGHHPPPTAPTAYGVRPLPRLPKSRHKLFLSDANHPLWGYVKKNTNHIYIYIYIYIYICTCTCTYTNIQTYKHIYIYIYIHVTSQVHLTWWVPQKLNSRDTGRIFWSQHRCLRRRPSAGRAPSPIPTWSDSTSF